MSAHSLGAAATVLAATAFLAGTLPTPTLPLAGTVAAKPQSAHAATRWTDVGSLPVFVDSQLGTRLPRPRGNVRVWNAPANLELTVEMERGGKRTLERRSPDHVGTRDGSPFVEYYGIDIGQWPAFVRGGSQQSNRLRLDVTEGQMLDVEMPTMTPLESRTLTLALDGEAIEDGADLELAGAGFRYSVRWKGQPLTLEGPVAGVETVHVRFLQERGQDELLVGGHFDVRESGPITVPIEANSAEVRLVVDQSDGDETQALDETFDLQLLGGGWSDSQELLWREGATWSADAANDARLIANREAHDLRLRSPRSGEHQLGVRSTGPFEIEIWRGVALTQEAVVTAAARDLTDAEEIWWSEGWPLDASLYPAFDDTDWRGLMLRWPSAPAVLGPYRTWDADRGRKTAVRRRRSLRGEGAQASAAPVPMSAVTFGALTSGLPVKSRVGLLVHEAFDEAGARAPLYFQSLRIEGSPMSMLPALPSGNGRARVQLPADQGKAAAWRPDMQQAVTKFEHTLAQPEGAEHLVAWSDLSAVLGIEFHDAEIHNVTLAAMPRGETFALNCKVDDAASISLAAGDWLEVEGYGDGVRLWTWLLPEELDGAETLADSPTADIVVRCDGHSREGTLSLQSERFQLEWARRAAFDARIAVRVGPPIAVTLMNSATISAGHTPGGALLVQPEANDIVVVTDHE